MPVLQLEDVVHVQLRKAAQHWPLEVDRFAVDIGLIPERRFLLFASMYVQLVEVLVERKTKKKIDGDTRLERSDDATKADRWRT